MAAAPATQKRIHASAHHPAAAAAHEGGAPKAVDRDKVAGWRTL